MDVTKEMFLELLVAQIRHQDPLNPSDGTQFLTQLAEFTNLEQTIAIKDHVGAIRGALDPRPRTPASMEMARQRTRIRSLRLCLHHFPLRYPH